MSCLSVYKPSIQLLCSLPGCLYFLKIPLLGFPVSMGKWGGCLPYARQLSFLFFTFKEITVHIFKVKKGLPSATNCCILCSSTRTFHQHKYFSNISVCAKQCYPSLLCRCTLLNFVLGVSPTLWSRLEEGAQCEKRVKMSV